MPALFIYLIKVNVALLIFCAGYYAVLRHLTFYNLNRVYLVTAIIFSSLYPWVNLTDFLYRHKEIAKPVQVVIINWQEPVKTIANTFWGHDTWFWLQTAFWAGVTVFGIRLLTQLLSLYRLHKLSEPAQLHQYVIRVIKGNVNPFSFWRSIYINPDNHPSNELNAILKHEQIHVNEWHTLDILLGEVSAIFYWFNPGIWLMKRAIRENIEFITDQKILQQGVDTKAYQYSLLNVNFGAQGNTIVNHFNISTIKKRIVMMNAKRSRKINVTRYLLLIPAVMMLLLIFSVSKAELNKAVKNSAHMLVSIKTAITKIKFIPNTRVTTNGRRKTEMLTALSLIKVDDDTTRKEKRTFDLKMNYTFTYDSAGKKGNKEFHIITDVDTNKKAVIKINGSVHPDIYINGIKTDVELENLSPNKIGSVIVKKDTSGKGNRAIYITTGNNIHGVLNYKLDTIINGKRIKADRNTSVSSSVTGSVSSNVFITGKPLTKVTINGKAYDHTSNRVIVNGDTVYANNIVYTSGQRLPKVDSLVDKLNAFNSNVKVVTGYRIGPDRIANVRTNSPISFENKLIIIDGKAASAKQMKKLSADKINTISNLSGASATSVYGDKGKNGVIVITTRK